MARKSRRFGPLAARLCREVLTEPIDGALVDAVAALFRQLDEDPAPPRPLRARLVMEYVREDDGSWDYKFFVESATDGTGQTVPLSLSLAQQMLARAIEMAPEMFNRDGG